MLLRPSNAIPALIAPSPMTLTTSNFFFKISLATVIPKFAAREVEL